jgi:arylsulfatase A-like enzyme
MLMMMLMCCGASLRAATQPNIVFLFADDQRFDMLGCAGQPILQTPNIDRLAAQGVRFNNMFVTTSICWVSRAIVLTGQWARTHSVPRSMPDVKDESFAGAYPPRLRQAGYRTAFFGKWHIKPASHKPEALYDEQQVIGRNPYLKKQPDGSLRHEAQLIVDRGVEFIARQDPGRPFCLNLWFNTAHAEDGDRRPGFHYQWPATVDDLYRDVTFPPPRLGDPAIFQAMPEFLKQSLNRERFFWSYDTPEKYQANLRAYHRMISGLDREIGRVVQALKDKGLADNTIIVYSADNGYYLGDRGFQGKWSHFEESLRVPLIVYDPRLPENLRGRVVDQMALNVDLPATFLDWAGVPRPESYQGRSLAPIVRGQPPSDWRGDFFCEHLDLSPHLVWEGVRGSRHVYARYVHQTPAYEFLHDLQADPDELKNLAGDPSSADVLAAMRRRCDELRGELGPPIPPADQFKSRAPGKDDKAQKKAKQK